MVQEDAHIAVRILLIAERILHLGLASIGAAGEIVVAHGDGRVAIHLNLVVVEHNLSPALATVDSKASILLMTILNCSVADKVRHSVGSGWPELGFSCLQFLGGQARWQAFTVGLSRKDFQILHKIWRQTGIVRDIAARDVC